METIFGPPAGGIAPAVPLRVGGREEIHEEVSRSNTKYTYRGEKVSIFSARSPNEKALRSPTMGPRQASCAAARLGLSVPLDGPRTRQILQAVRP